MEPHGASKLEKEKQFSAVDVPSFSHQVLGRDTERVQLLEQIKQLAASPQEGVLLVGGSVGVGKTSLVADVLRNKPSQDVLMKELGIRVAFWLNCGEWSKNSNADKEFDETAKRRFVAKLLAMARRAANDQSAPFFNLASILAHFAKAQKNKGRPLFVLDDATPPIVEFLKNELGPGGLCLAISSEKLETFVQKSSLIRANFKLEPLGDELIRKILSQNDKQPDSNLSGNDALVSAVVKRCEGLPLVASLMSALHDGGEGVLENCDENLATLEFISEVFDVLIGQVEQETLLHFCSFLFFEPEEPVSMADLGVIWGDEKTDVSVAKHCLELEQLALVRKVGSPGGTCPDSKVERYAVHQVIHRVAIQSSQIRNLLENYPIPDGALLAALKLGYVTVSSEQLKEKNALVNLLVRTVGQERTCLWEKLLRDRKVCFFLYENHPALAKLQDPSGRTGLALAAKLGDLDTVQLLYEAFEQAVELCDKKFGQMPLSWAVANNAPLEVVKFLHAKNEDALRLRDAFFGQTPLSLSVEYSSMEMLLYLFEHNEVAVRMEDMIGRTALSAAAELGRADMVKFLYEKFPGAVEMTDDCYERTPLCWAAENGHVEIVKFLYEKFPVAVKLPDDDRKTPKDRAAMNGHQDVVDFLQSVIHP